MNYRSILLIVISASIVAAGLMLFWQASSSGDEPVSIAIVTTSDLQSRLLPFKNETGSPVGGIGRIATMKAKIEEESDITLLISSGDEMFGSFYTMYSGRPEMEAMTAAGYDVACPGNHEFDYGKDLYLEAAGFAGFPIVCSNVFLEDPSPGRVIRESAMFEESGVKIGVFGLMTPDLSRLSSPGEGVRVDPDITGIAGDMSEKLHSEGADLVIAVTQTGIETARRIAETVPGIDLIICSLDNGRVYETVVGPENHEAIIVQDGLQGEGLGVLRFTYVGDGIRDPVFDQVWLDNTIPVDPAVESIVGPYLADYTDRLSQPIGEITRPLDTRKSTVRTGEAAAGNLITDAWRAHFPESRIAFFNGGGIRGDTLYPAGDVDFRTISEVLPFNDEIVVIQMKGSDIRQVLECSASALGPEYEGIGTGGFLQVSGLHYEIDINETPYSAIYNGSELVAVKNAGSRIRNMTVEEPDGSFRPLDDEETYTVLVNAWLAGGGDGYWIFSAAEKQSDTGVYDIDPVLEYIRENSPLSPVVEGRIRIH